MKKHLALFAALPLFLLGCQRTPRTHLNNNTDTPIRETQDQHTAGTEDTVKRENGGNATTSNPTVNPSRGTTNPQATDPTAAANDTVAPSTNTNSETPREDKTPERHEDTASPTPTLTATPTPEPEPEKKDDIVIYFSATGTTRGVAEKIQNVADSDIYEIVPKVPYTSEDLDYSRNNTRATREQRDNSARPEIASPSIDLTDYSTIYLGYPIWWSQAPKIMYTFVEAHSFVGKTVKPFVTSGGSGVGSSSRNLAKASDGGDWKNGIRFNRNVSDSQITSWLNR